VFLTLGEIVPWGDFEWQGGEKNKGGNRGGEATQRGRKCSTTNPITELTSVA